MKILHLTIKKKWFDLIASGNKKIEYREAKHYWAIRLMDNIYTPGINATFKELEEVHFRNGYKKDSPFMRVVFVKISAGDPDKFMPCNGEILKGRQFAIYLGDILEVRRAGNPEPNAINSGKPA